MATALVTHREVEPAVPAVTEKQVTLTLSEDEATTLAVILQNIGGNPETTPRGFAGAIREALDAFVYTEKANVYGHFDWSRSGGLFFRPDYDFGIKR